MSKKLITGKAMINVNGKRLKTQDGATLNPGGENRTAVVGGGEVHGFQEETVPPSIDCVVVHDKSVSIRELSDLTGATVFFETDSGAEYVLRDAWTSEPASLATKEGTANLRMEAIACDEV